MLRKYIHLFIEGKHTFSTIKFNIISIAYKNFNEKNKCLTSSHFFHFANMLL